LALLHFLISSCSAPAWRRTSRSARPLSRWYVGFSLSLSLLSFPHILQATHTLTLTLKTHSHTHVLSLSPSLSRRPRSLSLSLSLSSLAPQLRDQLTGVHVPVLTGTNENWEWRVENLTVSLNDVRFLRCSI